jgi:hypothetical protein
VTSFVIGAFEAMKGILDKFYPENSTNRFIIGATLGFGGDCLRFYATLGFALTKVDNSAKLPDLIK